MKVGFVGWRGMVGSVLMGRMLEENDFDGGSEKIEPLFFTTSNVGGQGPDIGVEIPPLKDAYDIEALKSMDAEAMARAVPDALVDEIGIVCRPDEARERLAQWQPLTDEPLIYAPTFGVPRERLLANLDVILETFGG